MRPSAAAIAISIAGTQLGFIRRAQLIDAGVPKSSVNNLVYQGVLGRAGRGVLELVSYAVGQDIESGTGTRAKSTSPRSPTAPLLATSSAIARSTVVALNSANSYNHVRECIRLALSVGPDAVITGMSALTIHGVVDSRQVGTFEPRIATTGRRRSKEIASHNYPVEATVRCKYIYGVRVSSVERAIFEISAETEQLLLEQVIEQAIFGRFTSETRLAAEIARPSSIGRRGIVVLRKVLHQRRRGSKSALETRFIQLIRSTDLPQPDLQHRIRFRNGSVAVVDAYWKFANLVVELDGRTFHSDPISFEKDRSRQNRLVGAGLKVLRFTWHDVVNNPDVVVHTISNMLLMSG